MIEAREARHRHLASVGGGLRIPFARRWGFEASLRADRHFTDWTVTDRRSGRTAALEDYTVTGIDLGLSRSF